MAFPSIKITVGADTGRLKKDLKKGEGIVSSFTKTAGTALTGLAVAAGAAAVKIGVDGVKAAIEDEASQSKLAITLKNVTDARKQDIVAVEDYIEKTTMATGVTDDELRPSLDRLIRSTKDVAKAQQLQTIALDVAAGTGKDLQAVTNAIAKAYDGNFGALKRLGVPLSDAIVKSKDFNKVQQVLADTFKGQMDASLDTQAGKLKLLNTRWQEMQEQIGYVLLDGLEPLMDWASGPEGQAFLEDFMVAFKDAAISVAKALPGILDTLKQIGKAAGAFGINFDTLMTPEVLAAGAAFRVTPGGPQMKALAALAAYASVSAKGAEEKGDESWWQKAVNLANPMNAISDIRNGEHTSMWTGGLTNPLRNAISSRLHPVDNSVTITVNGSTDPAATAKAVQTALAKAKRMGVNLNALGTGT